MNEMEKINTIFKKIPQIFYFSFLINFQPFNQLSRVFIGFDLVLGSNKRKNPEFNFNTFTNILRKLRKRVQRARQSVCWNNWTRELGTSRSLKLFDGTDKIFERIFGFDKRESTVRSKMLLNPC